MAEQESPIPEQMNELLFMQLVMMFQSAAFQHMGKVMNPVTNKVERDLPQAKNSIDILGMLEEKTKGNLSDNEKRLLEHALYELRMNYVEESNRPTPEEEKKEEDAQSDGSEEGKGEQAAADEKASEDVSEEDEA